VRSTSSETRLPPDPALSSTVAMNRPLWLSGRAARLHAGDAG
jgi:hypothetical protein